MPAPFAPRSPEQRVARQVARTAPGLVGGRVPSVAPVQARRAQDRTAQQLPSALLWVGTDEPTDGSVLWYDTDATC